MNQKIYITRGLSGAGKSTWTREAVQRFKNSIRISRDEIRFMLWNGDMVNDDKEVFFIRNSMMEVALKNGYNLIIDETYLAPHRVQQLNNLILAFATQMNKSFDIEIQDFIWEDIEKCIERDKPRGKNRHVGEAFIRSYYENYILPLRENIGVTRWTIEPNKDEYPKTTGNES